MNTHFISIQEDKRLKIWIFLKPADLQNALQNKNSKTKIF